MKVKLTRTHHTVRGEHNGALERVDDDSEMSGDEDVAAEDEKTPDEPGTPQAPAKARKPWEKAQGNKKAKKGGGGGKAPNKKVELAMKEAQQKQQAARDEREREEKEAKDAEEAAAAALKKAEKKALKKQNKENVDEEKDSDFEQVDNSDSADGGASCSDNESVNGDNGDKADDSDEETLDFDDQLIKRDMGLDTKSTVTHFVHAPYFPEDKYEWWSVYIIDRRTRQLIAPLQQVTTLVDEHTLDIRFPAPDRKGTHTYQVNVRSDSYLDCDVTKDVKFEVYEARPQLASHPQWDHLSDDDENNGGLPDSDDDGQGEASDSDAYTEGGSETDDE